MKEYRIVRYTRPTPHRPLPCGRYPPPHRRGVNSEPTSSAQFLLAPTAISASASCSIAPVTRRRRPSASRSPQRCTREMDMGIWLENAEAELGPPRTNSSRESPREVRWAPRHDGVVWGGDGAAAVGLEVRHGFRIRIVQIAKISQRLV